MTLAPTRTCFRAAWLAGAVLLGGCSDHPYRHEIRGRVTANGQPLAGAVVQRVNADGEAYGGDEAYRRVTEADGSFSFVGEGRGPKPLAYAPWALRVGHEQFPERTLEVHAQWSEGGACFGYCATDFAIDLTAAGSVPVASPPTAASAR